MGPGSVRDRRRDAGPRLTRRAHGELQAEGARAGLGRGRPLGWPGAGD